MEKLNINNNDFMKLVNYMKDRYGINLTQKLTLVEGRLWSVLKQKGFETMGEYFNYVINDPTGEEAKTLVTRLTTNYTYFMREDQHYKFLENVILPDLRERLRPRDLRIWSAGCSSGEEPYTTAMVLDNFFGSEKSQWDAKILATDISPSVLKMAGEAIYPEERLQNVSAAWKSKYFEKMKDGQYKVHDSIKNEVIFRNFNLMQDTFPFKKKFHVIFCRNVMIYFDKPTRDNLVDKYYHALDKGGYLFIGLSETLGKEDIKFRFIQPSIYRKD